MQCLQSCRIKMLCWFMGLLAHSCACMLICLLSLVIDGTVYFLVLFFVPDFRECYWAPLTGSQWELRCSKIWKNLFLCCRGRLPPMHSQLWKVPTALYSTARASSFVPGKLCNAALSDQCKRFWHKKTKSVGTAQTKLNCKIKEHRQFSWLYYSASHLFN